MTLSRRPLSVTVLAWVYIVVGAAGFVFGFQGRGFDSIFAELVRLLAVLAGVFMLRGENWARWLAIVWMAFHVVLSAFHSFSEFAVHVLFGLVIAGLLLRSDSAGYFRRLKRQN
jgi:hypothetical protein